MNVKDVWFDSYDEEGTLRSLAWTWTHLAALEALNHHTLVKRQVRRVTRVIQRE